MYISSRWRIQTKPMSNWLHGKLEICGDISPLLMMWQALTLMQNWMPWQPFHAFWRWSWHVWSLQLSIMQWLWISLPGMGWRPPRLDRSIRCFCLQNECYPHYHTTDSVLTIISQHIWIKIRIVLGILIIFEKFRTGKSCMRICISGRQIDDFRRLSSGSVTGWGGWYAGQRWSRLWSPHSASGGGRCTRSFVSPACLRILGGAILARKAAGSLVMT